MEAGAGREGHLGAGGEEGGGGENQVRCQVLPCRRLGGIFWPLAAFPPRGHVTTWTHPFLACVSESGGGWAGVSVPVSQAHVFRMWVGLVPLVLWLQPLRKGVGEERERIEPAA